MPFPVALEVDGPCSLVVAGNGAAGTGRLVGRSGSTGNVPMIVWNADTTNPAFLASGPDAATAATNAGAVPTAGTPKQVIACPPNSVQLLMLQTGVFYSGYGVGGAVNVYLTPCKRLGV